MNEADFHWHRNNQVIPAPPGLQVWVQYEGPEKEPLFEGPFLVLAIAVGVMGATFPGEVQSDYVDRVKADGTKVTRQEKSATESAPFNGVEFDIQVSSMEWAQTYLLLASGWESPWVTYAEVRFSKPEGGRN